MKTLYEVLCVPGKINILINTNNNIIINHMLVAVDGCINVY